ncbi:MAG: hypothetical protein GF350_01060 [Chitinivibrionales bacterium]|nr:hypothetical protein [Chitinivibrionales bacterium]
MKFYLVLLSCVCCTALRCSVPTDATTSGTQSHPPLPRTQSIIPLHKGNQWRYSYTDYDSSGKIIHSRWQLDLAISDFFGFRDDSIIDSLTWDNYTDTGYEYIYEYEWESTDTGFYITYRDVGVASRGLYLIGEYNYLSGRTQIYDSARLWLAYPGTAGDRWTLHPDITADSYEVSVEIISTDAQFYCSAINPDNASALSFCDCYLYKETAGNSTRYYYYNENIGALGYLHYIGNTLRTSYLLSSFRNASN